MMQKKEKILGELVSITKGVWKGYQGDIKDVHGDNLRITLDTSGKVVKIPAVDVIMVKSKRRMSVSPASSPSRRNSVEEDLYAQEDNSDEISSLPGYGGGYEAENIEMNKEEKKIFEQVTKINSYLLFPFEMYELKELSIELREFLNKNKGIGALDSTELAIMSAALLLLVAGKRELAPEDVSKKCPVKYNNVSYLSCILKDVIKDNNLEVKLDKAHKFLSKEMNISIKGEFKQRRVISKPKKSSGLVGGAEILHKKFPFVPVEDLQKIFFVPGRGAVSLTPASLKNFSKNTGIPEGEIVAASLKSGGIGRSNKYANFPKTEAGKTSRRPLMEGASQSTLNPERFKRSAQRIIKASVINKLDNKIQSSSGDNKKAFQFIKNNLDNSMGEIDEELKKLTVSSVMKKAIKKNIKDTQGKISDEILNKMKKMKI